MKKGFCLTLIALLLVGLVISAIPASAGASPDVTYWVQLAPSGNAIQVQVYVPAEAGTPVHLSCMRDYAGGRATSLASHYTITGAHDGTGLPLSVSGEAGNWLIGAPSDGQVTVSYVVNLDNYQSDAEWTGAAGGAGWPYFPLVAAGYLYLPGYSAFLYPDSLLDTGVARIYMQMPAGWNSIGPVPPANGAFTTDWRGLTGNAFVSAAGGLVAKQGNVAGTDVTLALAPGAGSTNLKSLDEAFARLSNMAKQAVGLLNQQGGAGNFLLLFTFGSAEQPNPSSYEAVASFEATAAIALPADANILSLDCTQYMGSAVWNFLVGKTFSERPLPPWFTYGAAGYYQLALPFKAGLMSGSDFWDLLNAVYGDYSANPNVQTLNLATAGELLPNGGAERFLEEKGPVVVASMDQRIRDVTSNRYSLDDLMKRLAGTDGFDPGTLDEAGLQRNLESLTSVSWKDFFDQNVTGTAQVKSSSFSNLTSLGQQSTNTTAGQPVQSSGPTKSWAWIFVGLAILLIFAIPVLLEPYTLRPRKGSKAADSDSNS